MNTNRFSRYGMLWAVAGLVLAGFVITMAHENTAQAQKATTKAKDKDKGEKDKDAPKKEAKIEPPPATFPVRKDLPPATGAQHVALIDEHITKGWKANSTYPSERCTDYEFIRRASLDIVGRIPTIEEINAFMKHTEQTRRAWLIDAMLDGKEYGRGEEFAKNFADLWTVHLMTRSGSNKGYQQQMNDWLKDQFSGDSKDAPDWSKTATQLISGAGITNGNPAINFLLHNLGEEVKDKAKSGGWDMIPATSRTTRLFLGIRTQCVQCHDHPFNDELKQHHFWGVNAFLRQVDVSGKPGMMGKKKKDKADKGDIQQLTLKDNLSFNTKGIISYERRNAVLFFTEAEYLDKTTIPENYNKPRREKLAELITKDPSFGKAFVNRMWGHFFGSGFMRGLVDDFHEQNPVSHPELLNTLSKDWAEKYGHNPKALVRWICNSQAYGLSSKANKWNDKTDDETLFARMLLKPMSPEVMYASVTVATHPRWQKYTQKEKDAKLAKGETWFNQLVSNFGNDEGEEGSYSGTVVQALLMMNGQETNKALTDPEGTVAQVEKNRGASYPSLKLAIQDMYMHALGRPASDKELKDYMSPAMYNFRAKGGAAPPPPNSQPTAFWSAYYQDIMWALLNSNEFILNH